MAINVYRTDGFALIAAFELKRPSYSEGNQIAKSSRKVKQIVKCAWFARPNFDTFSEWKRQSQSIAN
ncbi:hypothetical protein [Pseudomonas sp. Pseu.R1]|uniref:hypothetical protein n=1 Tax=Pseudomonas sp. Pseu.R1 TaxID=3379818 RepID=UPI003B9478CC